MSEFKEKYCKDFSIYFKYDETSKTNLRWIIPRRGRGGKPVGRQNDWQAGNFTSSNGISVNIEGDVFSVKNIIWTLFNGPIPKDSEVLFLDGDHTNTKIDNLFLSNKESLDFNRYLEYDETSPSCLRWKCKYAPGSTIRTGDVAGSLDNGYWRIHALGLSTKVHRVIWQMLRGEIPNGYQIDHINRDSSDNRIENLRCVDGCTNAQNKGKQKNNTTGVTGISYFEYFGKDGNLYKKLTASVSLVWNSTSEARKVSRSWSITKYGYDEAMRMATEWRNKMIAELNKQGAGYSETHGL